MEIIAILYIVRLLIAQAYAYAVAFGLDKMGKEDNYKKVVTGKLCVLFFRSNFEKKNKLSKKGHPISISSLIFQILNFLYLVAYVVFAFCALKFFSIQTWETVLRVMYFVCVAMYCAVIIVASIRHDKYKSAYYQARIRLLAKRLREMKYDFYDDPVVVYRQLKEAHYKYTKKQIEQALKLLQQEDHDINEHIDETR